ncbi:MAG: hypothetical protein J6P93_01075 [Alphaproteobacteria bacterium]|nr:hypothetical protein [Alphaproteobacteria bacterium]
MYKKALKLTTAIVKKALSGVEFFFGMGERIVNDAENAIYPCGRDAAFAKMEALKIATDNKARK